MMISEVGKPSKEDLDVRFNDAYSRNLRFPSKSEKRMIKLEQRTRKLSKRRNLKHLRRNKILFIVVFTNMFFSPVVENLTFNSIEFALGYAIYNKKGLGVMTLSSRIFFLMSERVVQPKETKSISSASTPYSKIVEYKESEWLLEHTSKRRLMNTRDRSSGQRKI